MALDIPTLIAPGSDKFQATSAAHYLHECIRTSELWDNPAKEQTEENAPQRLL